MALARSRAAARRVKDRWKAKQWYQVTAPAAFSSKVIGETLADDPEKLHQRRVETTMFELTGDMKQMHIKLRFKVNEVLDNNAKTQFDGYTMTSDYVRRLTRRGATKIPAVFDLRTKDGSRLRVKPFAVTDRRCQTTQGQAVRSLIHEKLREAAENSTQSAFLHALLVGDLTNDIYREARKIHPIRRIEVAKVEVLKVPAVEMDETPIVTDAPEPSEEPEPSEDEADASDDESEGEGVELAGDSEEE